MTTTTQALCPRCGIREKVRSYCAPCNAEYQAEWKRRQWHTNPDAARRRVKSHNLNKKYGINLRAYEALVIAQDGLCAICGSEEGDRLYVDHDHSTGEIRGLLCHTCNMLLSGLERPEWLTKAQSYLTGNP